MDEQSSYIRLFFLCIILQLMVSCSEAQENCAKPSDIIPTNRKIYIIGEAHLDVAENPSLSAGKTQITHQLSAESDIINYLGSNCAVTNFILEAPIHVEYFFTKFMETGDSSWIDFLHQEYQLGKVYNINHLAKNDTNIQLKCIDLDLSYHNLNAINALFWLSFFEPYPDIQKNKKTKSDRIYNNISFPQTLIDTCKLINNTIQPFLQYIWDARLYNKDTVRLAVYNTFKATFEQPKVMAALKAYYKEDYYLVHRILRSYIYSYGLKIDGYNADLEFRERMLYANFSEIYQMDTTTSYCIQIGAYHIMRDSIPGMLRERIEDKFKLKTYNIFSVAKGFEQHFSPYINTIEFNFKEQNCLQPINSNESLLRVR